MQFEAIYNQGRLEFNQPIYFHHHRFLVKIDIPEQEIAQAKTVTFPLFDLALFSSEVRAEIARLEAIQQKAASQPIANVDTEESEEERLRWAAFELRNESRREQGRAI